MSGRDWYAEADLNLDGSASNEWSIYDANDEGDDRRTIATVYGSAANAAMFAAAPKLAEALAALLADATTTARDSYARIDNGHKIFNDDEWRAEDPNGFALAVAARAALSKATGAAMEHAP